MDMRTNMRRRIQPDTGVSIHHSAKSRKTIFMLLVILSIGLLLSSCGLNMLGKAIPSGYISKEEHFDPDGWQDYTDYCKYQYRSAVPFENDARYHAVSDDELAEILGYYENFKAWMEVADRLDEFDFAPTCINAGDYCLIDDMEGKPIGDSSYRKYDNYNLYYFDRETLMLYYMHTNI